MSNELATTNNNGFMSTVDTSTKQGKISMVNALNSSVSLNDYIAKVKDGRITVVDIILNAGVRSQASDRNDESSRCINTHLILDNGVCVMSQSDGIARSAMAIIDAWDGEFGKGIVVQVNNTKLSNGRTLKTLSVIEDLN